MKKIVLCTLILCSACSINDANDDLDVKTQLKGNWEWLESVGGIDGRTETPESTGNSIFIEIGTTTVKKYVNDVLESELNYEIQFGESIKTSYETELIIYENGMKQSIEFDENVLILYDECYDCFQNKYIKK